MGTRGEERLKAITDAATEVVAERGNYGMTIQEVSDRVGTKIPAKPETTFRANLRLRPNSGSFLLC